MTFVYKTTGKVVIATLALLFITYQVLLWTFSYIPGFYRNEMFMIMFGSFIGGVVSMLILLVIIET